MTPPHPIVFLIDVDSALLDNDANQQDLRDLIERSYGRAARAGRQEEQTNDVRSTRCRDCSALSRMCEFVHPERGKLVSARLVEHPTGKLFIYGGLKPCNLE
jgi:hypothetical protein